MRWLAGLVCLLLGAGPAWADPALFVARGPGITAYLLGSVHALKPGVAWEDKAISAAFVAASECWFELVLPKSPGDVAAVVFARGLDGEHKLSDQLAPPDRERLKARAKALQLPGNGALLEPMRPWLAWMTLVAATLKQSGLDETSGVDVTLQHRAEAANKTVVGLETIEDQIGIFADLPPAEAVGLLHKLLAGPVVPKTDTQALVTAWLAGDVDRVGRMMNDVQREVGAGLADALLQKRNTAWAARLGTLEGSNKTILVTVGAGHLAGRGNLRDLLAQRHWTVARVP